MQQLRGQRVGVFIDVQNMYYSAKNLYNAKVNFKEILRYAVDGRTLIRAIAYVIKADIKEEKNFFEALTKIGYEVKSKDLQTFVGGAKKGDWDVGDGDYVPLVQHMSRAMGCKVEAMAFGRTSAGKLRDAVDQFTDMEHNKAKFLIKNFPKAAKAKPAPAAATAVKPTEKPQ